MKIVSVSIEGDKVLVGFRFDSIINDVSGVLAYLQLNGICGDGCMAQAEPMTASEIESNRSAAEKISARHAAMFAEDIDKAVQPLVTAAEKAVLLTDADATDADATAEDFSKLNGAPIPATRRRKRNPLEVADAGAAPLPSTAPPVEADTTSDAATTGESRRRRAPAPIAGVAKEPATATDTSSEAEAGPLGRRRAPSLGAPAPSAEAEGSTSATTTVSPSEEAAPLRRRRAAPSAEGTPATTAPTAETAASPEPGTRRRRAAAPVEPSPPIVEPVKETAPTPPASAPVASDGIPDAELSKAASRGAQMLTPAAVRAFVATFTLDDGTSCTSVNQIHPNDRRAFLDELAEKISAAQ